MHSVGQLCNINTFLINKKYSNACESQQTSTILSEKIFVSMVVLISYVLDSLKHLTQTLKNICVSLNIIICIVNTLK